MKANAPEKIYVHWSKHIKRLCASAAQGKGDIEYTRTDALTDAFIEKARKWFEKQPELYDANGVRVYGEEDFEDFVNYMKGE